MDGSVGFGFNNFGSFLAKEKSGHFGFGSSLIQVKKESSHFDSCHFDLDRFRLGSIWFGQISSWINLGSNKFWSEQFGLMPTFKPIINLIFKSEY